MVFSYTVFFMYLCVMMQIKKRIVFLLSFLLVFIAGCSDTLESEPLSSEILSSTLNT